MLGWLSQCTKHNTPASSGQPADSNRPFCGMFANFEDPPIESLNRPGVPYEGCWGMLSKYVAWHMPKERVKSYADRALAVTPKGQWYLAVWIAREALFA